MKFITLLLLAATACAAGSAHAAPIPTGPIYTNKSRFRIPFHYDSDELARMGAREIRLSVSRDRGRSWQLVQSVTPDVGKFNFQAPSDGEYWFNVRTIDARNRQFPEGPAEPGLQVIVDTTPPSLKLTLRSPAPGKVLLSWTASDEHLDPAQLRLEYMAPGSSDWQTISVVPKAADQHEWSVPGGGLVAVRGSIGDLAKNTSGDQVQRPIAPAVEGVPRPRSPTQREPVAGREGTPGDATALTLSDDFPGKGRAQTAQTKEPPRTARRDNPPATVREPDAGDAPRIRGNLVSHRPDDAPAAASLADKQLAASVTGPRRIVNNRRFQIGYRLQDQAARGAASVELFISDDGGATWYRYPTDDDRQSPIHVEVPRDGVYGFTLSIKDAAGQVSEVPKNGDQPALAVVVDTQSPWVELLPLEQGRGKNADKIRISWRYADAFPAEKPVTLSYSTTGQAPWQPICEGIENTGSHIWTVGPEVPGRFFVRIEAKDEAGNLQAAETPQAVVLKPADPTARRTDAGSSAGKVAVPKE